MIYMRFKTEFVVVDDSQIVYFSFAHNISTLNNE